MFFILFFSCSSSPEPYKGNYPISIPIPFENSEYFVDMSVSRNKRIRSHDDQSSSKGAKVIKTVRPERTEPLTEEEEAKAMEDTVTSLLQCGPDFIGSKILAALKWQKGTIDGLTGIIKTLESSQYSPESFDHLKEDYENKLREMDDANQTLTHKKVEDLNNRLNITQQDFDHTSRKNKELHSKIRGLEEKVVQLGFDREEFQNCKEKVRMYAKDITLLEAKLAHASKKTNVVEYEEVETHDVENIDDE